MNHAAVFSFAFILSGGLLTPAMADEPTAFESCVDREAPLAFGDALIRDQSAALYGSNIEAINDVLNKCIPALGERLLTDRDRAIVEADVLAEAQVALAKKEADDIARLSKQMAEADQKEKIAEQELRRASDTYHACLSKHARTLALTSSEPADIVAEAAMTSCPPERDGVAEAFKRGFEFDGGEFVAKLDAAFQKKLVGEIVVLRAKAAAPRKVASKPRSPI